MYILFERMYNLKYVKMLLEFIFIFVVNYIVTNFFSLYTTIYYYLLESST